MNRLADADRDLNFQQNVKAKRPTERPATRSSANVDGKKRKAEEELSRGNPPKLAKRNDPPARVSKFTSV